MVGDPVLAEPAPIPLGKADASCGSENGEIPAATYEKLRRLDVEYLRSERPDHTLQATALLHEAFLRASAVQALATNSNAVLPKAFE
jgi:hypothetical protein